MRKLPVYQLLLCALTLLAACGTSAPQQPIKAQDPMYLLMIQNQNMVLSVINRPAYTLAGVLSITTIGNTPPTGDIGIAAHGSVIVTHTGAFTNIDGGYKETVQAETLVCTPEQGQCSSLIHGWGSATVDKIGQSFVVPIWQNTDPFHGQLAIFSDASIQTSRRISLPSILPGLMQISPDGKSLYWLSPQGTNNPTYLLVRFDLASQKITDTYNLGASIPGGLAVADDGTVYTTILYANQGNRTQGVATTNKPGTQILVFDPNLHEKGQFTVGAEPTQIAISADTIAVTYAPDQSQRIDIFSRTSLQLLRTLTSPYLSPIDKLSALSTGEFAITVTVGSQTNLGIWEPTSNTIKWHTYSGISIGGIAG